MNALLDVDHLHHHTTGLQRESHPAVVKPPEARSGYVRSPAGAVPVLPPGSVLGAGEGAVTVRIQVVVVIEGAEVHAVDVVCRVRNEEAVVCVARISGKV